MTESPEHNEVSTPSPSAETELPCQVEKLPSTDDGVKMDQSVAESSQVNSVESNGDNRNGSQSDDSFHGLNISPFKAQRKTSNSECISEEQSQNDVTNTVGDCCSNDQVNSFQCNRPDEAAPESLEPAHAFPQDTQNSGFEGKSSVVAEPETSVAQIENTSKETPENERSESAENEEPSQKEALKTNSNPTTDIGGIQFQLKKKDYEIPKKSQNAIKNLDDSSTNKLTMADISKEPSAEELEKFGLPPQFNNYLNERNENASGGGDKEGYFRRNFNDFSSARDRSWQGSRGGFQSPRGRWGNAVDIDSGRVNRNFFDRGGRGGFRAENRDGDHFSNQRNRFESQGAPHRVSKWEPIGEKREIQPPPFEPPRKDDFISSGQTLNNHSSDRTQIDEKLPEESKHAAESQSEENQLDVSDAKSPSRKRCHSENKSESNNPETSEQPQSRNRSRSKSSDSRKRRRERSSSRRKDSDRDSRRSRERHNKDYSSRNRDSDDHRSSRHRRSRSRSRRRNDSDRYGRSDYRRNHSRGQDDDYSRHKRSSHRDDHGSRRYSRYDDEKDRRRHDDDSDRRSSKEETESKPLDLIEETASQEGSVSESDKVSTQNKVGGLEEQSTPTKDEPNFEFTGSSSAGSHGFQEIPKLDSDRVDTASETPDFGIGAPFMRFPLGGFDPNRSRFRGDFNPRNRFPRNPRPNFQHRMHAPPMMNPALNAMVNQPRMSAQQQQPPQAQQQQFAQIVSPNPQQRFPPAPASFQRSPSSAPTFANPAFPGAPGLPAGVPPQNFLGGRIPFPFNNQQMRGQQPFPPNFLQQFAANMGNPNATAEAQALLQGNDIRSVMNPANLNAVGFPPGIGQDGAANSQANMTAALLNQIESSKLLQSISSHPAAVASVFATASPQQQQLQEAANLLKDMKTPTAVSVGSSNPGASAAVSPISLATIQSNMPMINNILESQLFQPPPPNNVEAPNNPLSFFQQQDHQQSSIIPETFFAQNSSPQSVEMEDSAGVNESSMHGPGSPSNSIGQSAIGGANAEEPPFLRSLATSDDKKSSQAIPFMENKIDEPLEKGISLVKEMLKKKNSGNFGEENSGSDHHSDIESSANEMQLKKKLVDRSEMQTKVAELVKGLLMPHFKKKIITKDEYKDIMRKSVNKVVKRGSSDIKEEKISKLVNAYVDHYRAKRTKSSKDDDLF